MHGLKFEIFPYQEDLFILCKLPWDSRWGKSNNINKIELFSAPSIYLLYVNLLVNGQNSKPYVDNVSVGSQFVAQTQKNWVISPMSPI